MSVDVRTPSHRRAVEGDDAPTTPIVIPARAGRPSAPVSVPSAPVPSAPVPAVPRSARRAAPAPAPAPYRPRAAAPRKRRRVWPWVVAALFVLVVVIASTSNNTPTTGTAPAASGTSGSSAVPVAPAAGSSATPATPAVAPKVYNGKGDNVITIDKPSGVAVMTFSCPKCSGNTIVQSDGAESLLVNTIGSYTGKRWLDATSGSTTSKLTIKATGSWKVTIGGLDQATHASGRVAGKGDDVVQLDGSTSTAAVTNRGQGNFIVQTAGGDSLFSMPTLPVNEIGSYSGTVPLSAPALVQVTSEGSWTITPQP